MPHFECGAFNHSATSPKGRRRAAKNPRARMAEPDNMRRRAGSSATVAQGSKIPTTQKDGGRVAFSAELNIVRLAGGVAEWLKAHAWKVCMRETVSRVRIPPPPPAKPQQPVSAAAETFARPEELRAFCLRPPDCRTPSDPDFRLSPAQNLRTS